MTTGGKPSILRAEADQTVAASSSSSFGETGGGEESPGSIGQGAGNAWGVTAHDQCNREQTADGPRKRDQVR